MFRNKKITDDIFEMGVTSYLKGWKSLASVAKLYQNCMYNQQSVIIFLFSYYINCYKETRPLYKLRNFDAARYLIIMVGKTLQLFHYWDRRCVQLNNTS